MDKVAKLSVLLTILLSATANAADCSITSTGNIPLYPSIFVPRTAEEQSAALAAVNSIPAGPTVLLSIGMSNAKGIWDKFKSDAEVDTLKNPDVQVVNGAQAGGAVASWASEGLEKTWGELDESLGNVGVTKKDISVIWFMLANTVKSSSTPETYSTTLETDTRNALDLFAIEFPNLKVVWLQSMIYAGYSTASGNREPYAHETGVVAQRVLVDQSWPFFVGYGPYLWADGTVPRDDGLTWLCSDFKDDGNHPDTGAKIKHSDNLIRFFHEDSVASIGYLDSAVMVTVPDLVGLDQANAELSIVSANLVIGTVSMANSDTVLAGNVISQNPTGGGLTASGTSVDLVVSLGPLQLLTVPDVVGLDQATAESAIVSASFVVGAVSTANSDTVSAGDVISQNPTGGSLVASGTAVDLVVSTGPSIQVTVPDVVGLDQATAESSIVSASLVVGTISTANSDTMAAGNVISQSPTGGSSVVSNTAVDLVVSLGPATGVPMMISPANGSTVSGSSETFTWSAEGETVDRWRLEVGTTPDGTEILVQGVDATTTSLLVSGLPTDGSTVYVNLKWRISGVASTASYIYTANGGTPGIPSITSPAPGSTLASGGVNYSWTGNGTTVDDWQLLVGFSIGDNSLYDSGVLLVTTTSVVVNGLPEDGSTIHVTLRWNESGVPSEVNYTYTASSGPGGGVPMMLSPVDGSTLSGSSETFTWSAEGETVDKWRLEVGTTPDGRDLFVQGIDATTTSTLVSGLPTDGSIVYVNLKWRISGVTSVASYVYTASLGGP